tara:strand:- start:591 stop:896 length:306 start_codon:yes stop_codon:yes gene_type:complete
MKNLKHPTEIDKLYNDKQISLGEATELRTKWGELSESEKKNYTLSKSKSTSSEISDREIQEKILENLRNIRNSNSSIKGWVTFFGILQILGILAAIVIYNS